ncbi:hypothetical protein BpHYR1_014128 [Brachionus plicatilis]|uniref:Uncharacterized protein n=1 Tax=Brachionus plicatilis TaxID=10195 RepID=A0A3M7RZV9_BRAPC|nr:hypothetical protein BpHYR1_014128 [Brachionus plicatilis]
MLKFSTFKLICGTSLLINLEIKKWLHSRFLNKSENKSKHFKFLTVKWLLIEWFANFRRAFTNW